MVKRSFKRLVWILEIGVVVNSLGCQGEPNDMVSAKGRVTCQGKPLSGVVLTMEPIGQTKGASISAPVIFGQFDIGSRIGLRQGTYQVRFSMIPDEIRASIPPNVSEFVPPRGAAVARRYDTDSQLSWTLNSGDANLQNFEIEILQPPRPQNNLNKP